MRNRAAVSLVVGSLILLATPSYASTTTVSITGTSTFAYTPSSTKVAMGNSVAWDNTTAMYHTSTQDQSIWNTGTIRPGKTTGTVTLGWAGSYTYHCNFHAYMVGTVKVPIKITANSSTSFTIIYATAALPTGFKATVQEKAGSGSWTNYKTGLTGTSTTFSTTIPGTYSFRSMLVSSSTKTKPSPASTITVS